MAEMSINYFSNRGTKSAMNDFSNVRNTLLVGMMGGNSTYTSELYLSGGYFIGAGASVGYAIDGKGNVAFTLAVNSNINFSMKSYTERIKAMGEKKNDKLKNKLKNKLGWSAGIKKSFYDAPNVKKLRGWSSNYGMSGALDGFTVGLGGSESFYKDQNTQIISGQNCKIGFGTEYGVDIGTGYTIVTNSVKI